MSTLTKNDTTCLPASIQLIPDENRNALSLRHNAPDSTRSCPSLPCFSFGYWYTSRYFTIVTDAPQKLSIKVDSPTNKDMSNVRLYYPNGGKLQWSTGSTCKAGSANYNAECYCENILDGSPGGWIVWQSGGRSGFDREFDCVFRGWKGNFGDTI